LSEKAPPAGRAPADSGRTRAANALFIAALTLYAGTRLAGLTRFPIFFFCDEATQANVAERLLRHGFRDEGVLFPPYFLNDQRWAMSLNIYALVPAVALFGKTILATRATFVLVALLGAAFLGLALRAAGGGLWWTAPAILAALPVDFLHSRMALETTPAFFAGLIWAYLLYRLRSPRYLFLVLLFAAATFYSYTAGQGIVLVMGVLLLFSDLRYHLRQRPALFAAALLFAAILAIPFLRERHRHPNSTREQLVVLHSYWITPIPLSKKLATFAKQYATGFDPRYWFLPSGAELIRHRMDEMAYFPLALAPLAALGIASCFARFRRSPAHRTILLSPLAVPFAAAVDHRQVLRVLPMVVPVVLLSAVGAEAVVRRLRGRVAPAVAAATFAAVLAVASVRLVVLSLRDGGTWFRDYGLYGMQYGAREVLGAIRDELRRSPGTRIFLASAWANNPDEFLDFFLTPVERARAAMGDIDGYRARFRPIGDSDVFVMTPDQYEAARRDPKLSLDPPRRTLRYPDGSPGFYFVRVRYAPGALAIFAEEREARRKPQEATVTIGGETVRVRHSTSDMGQASDLVDGRFDTLLRGLEANPFVVEFLFPSPRSISRIDLSLSRMNCEITIGVFPADGSPPRELRRKLVEPPGDSTQEFPLPAPVRASKVRVSVHETDLGEPAHIELRDVAFRP